MALSEGSEEVPLETFDVDIARTVRLIEKAIHRMDRNKAAGEDNLHVEMFKANAPKVALLLGKCWKVVGETRIMSLEWRTGTLVPLYKGNVTMGDPRNYRPLCILRHARKVVEKT